MKTSLTWESLVEAEPRLATLERRAVLCSSRDWRDFAILKRDLSRLVGWDSGRRDDLGTVDAYDVVHRRILDSWETGLQGGES